MKINPMNIFLGVKFSSSLNDQSRYPLISFFAQSSPPIKILVQAKKGYPLLSGAVSHGSVLL